MDAIPVRLISSVNYAECISTLIERGHSVQSARALLVTLSMQVVAFDEDQALEAARLRPITRAFGLSLGDRACLALATIRSLPAVTADRTWEQAAPHMTIVTIR